MIDLVVLVADADAEIVIKTLLNKRAQALGIRPITSKVIRYHGRDSGVFLHAHNLLRPYQTQATYALVMLDREGSGREHRMTAEQMEADIESRLRADGWQTPDGRSRAAVIVLDPELEIWVWSRSPHVPRVLGLDANRPEQVLEQFDCLPNGKPKRPKEALQKVLREARKPRSSAIYQELAERVSLQASERAFDKLRYTLQGWFPSQEQEIP